MLHKLLFLTLCSLAVAQLRAQQVLNHPDLSSFSGSVKEKLKTEKARFDEINSEGPDAESYGRLGMVYQAHELFSPAKQAYEAAYRLNSEDARWPYFLGVLSYGDGDFAQAINWFDLSARKNKHYLPTQIRLARTEIEQGELLRAFNRLERLVSQFATTAALYADLGRISVQRNQHEQAIRYFEQALALQPNASQLHYPLALAYRTVSNLEEAKRHIALRGSREVVFDDPLYNEMRSHSRSFAYLMSLGMSAARNNDFVRARDFLAEAVAANPDNPEVGVNYARMLVLTDQSDLAFKELARVLNQHPDFALAHMNLGMLFEFNQDDESAGDAYRQAVGLQSDLFEAQLLFANFSMRAGRFETAISAYQSAMKIKPERTELLLRQAAAAKAAGNCRQAIDIAFSRVRSQPEDLESLIAYARLVASCPEATELERSNAINASYNIYRLNSDLAVIETLAMVEAARGGFDQAVDFQAQAIFLAVNQKLALQLDWLRRLMQRYQQKQTSDQPWPDHHPFRNPRRITLQDLR